MAPPHVGQFKEHESEKCLVKKTDSQEQISEVENTPQQKRGEREDHVGPTGVEFEWGP